MKRNILIFLLLVVLAVALTACGEDKADEGTTAPTTEPTIIPSNPTTEDTIPSTEPSAPYTEATTPSTEPSAPSIEPSVPTMPEYVTWTEYVPGSIKLVPQNKDDFSFERKYRWVFYGYHIEFRREMLTVEQSRDWGIYWDELVANSNGGETQEEMMLVTMIKRYNIPKETFQKAINAYLEMAVRLGHDLTHENYEVPNLDIIYTFDNEIINRFYRYE